MSARWDFSVLDRIVGEDTDESLSTESWRSMLQAHQAEELDFKVLLSDQRDVILSEDTTHNLALVRDASYMEYSIDTYSELETDRTSTEIASDSDSDSDGEVLGAMAAGVPMDATAGTPDRVVLESGGAAAAGGGSGSEEEGGTKGFLEYISESDKQMFDPNPVGFIPFLPEDARQTLSAEPVGFMAYLPPKLRSDKPQGFLSFLTEDDIDTFEDNHRRALTASRSPNDSPQSSPPLSPSSAVAAAAAGRATSSLSATSGASSARRSPTPQRKTQSPLRKHFSRRLSKSSHSRSPPMARTAPAAITNRVSPPEPPAPTVSSPEIRARAQAGDDAKRDGSAERSVSPSRPVVPTLNILQMKTKTRPRRVSSPSYKVSPSGKPQGFMVFLEQERADADADDGHLSEQDAIRDTKSKKRRKQKPKKPKSKGREKDPSPVTEKPPAAREVSPPAPTGASDAGEGAHEAGKRGADEAAAVRGGSADAEAEEGVAAGERDSDPGAEWPEMARQGPVSTYERLDAAVLSVPRVRTTSWDYDAEGPPELTVDGEAERDDGGEGDGAAGTRASTVGCSERGASEEEGDGAGDAAAAPHGGTAAANGDAAERARSEGDPAAAAATAAPGRASQGLSASPPTLRVRRSSPATSRRRTLSGEARLLELRSTSMACLSPPRRTELLWPRLSRSTSTSTVAVRTTSAPSPGNAGTAGNAQLVLRSSSDQSPSRRRGRNIPMQPFEALGKLPRRAAHTSGDGSSFFAVTEQLETTPEIGTPVTSDHSDTDSGSTGFDGFRQSLERQHPKHPVTLLMTGCFFHNHAHTFHKYLEGLHGTHHKLLQPFLAACNFVQGITSRPGVHILEQPRVMQRDVILNDLACGRNSAVAVTDDGQVVIGAANSLAGPLVFGQQKRPKGWVGCITISSIDEQAVKAVACGPFHSVALLEDGSAYTWGVNELVAPHPRCGEVSGQLGHDLASPSVMRCIHSLPPRAKVVHAACGLAHTILVTAAGSAFSFGCNDQRQLGRDCCLECSGSFSCHHPQRVPLAASTHVRSAACGDAHSLLLLTTDTVLGFGRNDMGQVGLPRDRFQQVSTPQTVLTRVRHVVAGCTHSLALSTTGTVYGWGRNLCGEVGVPRARPHEPTLLSGFGFCRIEHVAAGPFSSAAVDQAGCVYLWGMLQGRNHVEHQWQPRLSLSLFDALAVITRAACGASHQLFTNNQFASELLKRVVTACEWRAVNLMLVRASIWRTLCALKLSWFVEHFHALHTRAVTYLHDFKGAPLALLSAFLLDMRDGEAEMRTDGGCTRTTRVINASPGRSHVQFNDDEEWGPWRVTVEPSAFVLEPDSSREVAVTAWLCGDSDAAAADGTMPFPVHVLCCTVTQFTIDDAYTAGCRLLLAAVLPGASDSLTIDDYQEDLLERYREQEDDFVDRAAFLPASLLTFVCAHKHPFTAAESFAVSGLWVCVRPPLDESASPLPMKAIAKWAVSAGGEIAAFRPDCVVIGFAVRESSKSRPADSGWNGHVFALCNSLLMSNTCAVSLVPGHAHFFVVGGHYRQWQYVVDGEGIREAIRLCDRACTERVHVPDDWVCTSVKRSRRNASLLRTKAPMPALSLTDVISCVPSPSSLGRAMCSSCRAFNPLSCIPPS